MLYQYFLVCLSVRHTFCLSATLSVCTSHSLLCLSNFLSVRHIFSLSATFFLCPLRFSLSVTLPVCPSHFSCVHHTLCLIATLFCVSHTFSMSVTPFLSRSRFFSLTVTPLCPSRFLFFPHILYQICLKLSNSILTLHVGRTYCLLSFCVSFLLISFFFFFSCDFSNPTPLHEDYCIIYCIGNSAERIYD